MKTALLAAVFFVSMAFLVAAIAAQAARVALSVRYGVWLAPERAAIPRLAFWPTSAPTLPPIRATGQATVFSEHDRDNPNAALGCVLAARRLRLSSLHDHMPVAAMRQGEGPGCGGIVYVEHGERTALAIVLDSGPYGRGEDGAYRGLIDLSPAVATAIDLPGRGLQRRGDVRVRWRRGGAGR